MAKPFICSYDFKKNVLTILIPEVHKDGRYVNSKWELQKEPYKGDVINSYNDGPLAGWKSDGVPFYEVESSSLAQEIKAREKRRNIIRQQCICRTDYAALKNLVQQLIHVDLDDVKNGNNSHGCSIRASIMVVNTSKPLSS